MAVSALAMCRAKRTAYIYIFPVWWVCFRYDVLFVTYARYYRHGLEEEDFLAAFEGVRTVQLGYDGLARALGSASGT